MDIYISYIDQIWTRHLSFHSSLSPVKCVIPDEKEKQTVNRVQSEAQNISRHVTPYRCDDYVAVKISNYVPGLVDMFLVQ